MKPVKKTCEQGTFHMVTTCERSCEETLCNTNLDLKKPVNVKFVFELVQSYIYTSTVLIASVLNFKTV